MKQVKAIVFDISGTLLDDIHVVWKTNSEAYERCGLNGFGTIEEFREKFSMPVPQFHRENGVPQHLVSEVDQQFRECYRNHCQEIEMFPDVIDTLEELKKRGILLGVASNIPSNFLREHLAEFGLDDYFEAIIGQEDAPAQKPSPEPVLAALRKLGVDPSEAMYVGDMEEDMIAAKAANTTATAITRDKGYHPRWRLEKHEPHYFISDLTELL